jgi:hypothetical protein
MPIIFKFGAEMVNKGFFFKISTLEIAIQCK